MDSMDPFAPIRTRIENLGRFIDAPAASLPTYRISRGNGRAHVEVEGSVYHFVVADRDTEVERVTTTSEDEVLYRVFEATTSEMAAAYSGQHREPGRDVRRPLFQHQLELLGRLNPKWAERRRHDIEVTLEKHPFVDD